MGQLIRARQRAITAILPHPGNTKILVPSRFGMIPFLSSPKTVNTVSLFRQDVIGTLVATGFSLLVEGAPVAIISVTQAATDEITVNYALQTLGDFLQLDYDGSGDWVGANGFVVGRYTVTGEIV